MRLRRALRRAALSTVLLATLLVLPAAAQAAPDWSTSTLTSTGPYTPGGTATYTLHIVNTGTATTADDTIALNYFYSAATVTGTPVVSGGQAAKVTPALNSNVVTVLNGFAGAGGEATVTFIVQLPDRYAPEFKLNANGTIDGVSFLATDANRIVTSGGPATVTLDDITPFPAVAVRNGAFVSRIRVSNRGSGPAQLVRLERGGIYGTAMPIIAPVPPAFNPTGTYTSGCVAITNGGLTCELGTLAPGASVEVAFTFADLTHFGSADAYFTGSMADGGQTDYLYLNVRVTDGSRADVDLSLTGPASAAGRAATTYTGRISNPGPAALGASVIRVDVTGFNASGGRSSEVATELDSISSITLSNGAVCARRIDSGVTQPNEYLCPITGLAVGASITVTIVANFPTSAPDQYASVGMDLYSQSFVRDRYSSRSTRLNVQRTATMEQALTGPAVIGAGRVAPVTLTVRNTGNSQLRYVGGYLTFPGSEATVDPAELPSGCRLQGSVSCTRLTLDPGATTSWTILVHAPANATGKVRVVSNAGEWDSSASNAFYGDWDRMGSALVMDVVKPSLAPLVGVSIAKPIARTGSQLAASGLPSTVTCPDSCRVNVQLRVSRALAARFGLIRPTKRGGFLVLGTASRARTGAGTVAVTTNLAAKYRTAFRVLRRPLALQRVTTVTSTAANTRDARWTGTTPFTVRAAARR